MSPIAFSTELNPTELPTMVRQMASIVGWKTWERRINGLKSELSANPLWEAFVLERHGLELAYGDVHKHLRSTGRCPWPPRTAEEYRLYSFLAVAVHLYPRLGSNGQARLAGAIRSSLEKDFGLGPLAFEMEVAAHLTSRGFEVEFHDLEAGGGYDFLAKSGSMKLEIECKHISADIGRQIHRRKLHDLGGFLYPAMSRAVDQGIWRSTVARDVARQTHERQRSEAGGRGTDQCCPVRTNIRSRRAGVQGIGSSLFTQCLALFRKPWARSDDGGY